MYWLLAAPIAYLAYSIYDKFSSKEKKAKKNWEENRRSVEKKIEEQERKLEDYLKRKKTEEDYYSLIDVHFSSMKIADQAYSLLTYSKIYYDAMNRNIKLTSDRKDKILNLFQTKIKYEKKLKLTEELEQIKEVRKALFNDKDTLNNQTKEFKVKLKEFNKRTSKFKFEIRDNCGNKGREWFDRLEQRKKQRK